MNIKEYLLWLLPKIKKWAQERELKFIYNVFYS